MIFVRSIFLLVFLLLQSALADAQNLLWSANVENGDLSDWSKDDCGGQFNSGAAGSYATNATANSGSWSARMDIATPSEPTSGTRLFRWCEPQRNRQLYYSAWYFIPTNHYVPNFWNIWQWKSKTSSRNDPFFTLNIGNRSDGSMHLYLFDWQRRNSYGQTTANIPVGRWFQVEGYYECAPDNTGRVIMWQDGQQLFEVSNVSTRYGDGDCQWSIDNYSDIVQPSPASIFVDDAAIGLSRIGMATAAVSTAVPSTDLNATNTANTPSRRNRRRR